MCGYPRVGAAMTRDVDRLTRRTFDVLVVGAGVYGLVVAADAAQRGLSVALIDRGDFGEGASSNHLRTIHGGLRYLQTLDFTRARDSVRERRILARIAPHALRPMPFALPLLTRGLRTPPVMRLGFMLDQLVAYDRNQDVPGSLRLPAGRVVSRAQALDLFPTLAVQPASSFALWYDYVTLEADRLTLAWAFLAAANSAELANYVEATTLLIDQRRIAGVRAVDGRTGRSLEIAARLTVNATGGAIDALLEPARASTATPMLLALNLVTSLDGGRAAIGGYASGRTLFMVPWRGKALFGTWETRSTPPADEPRSLEEAVHGFLSDVRKAFPAIHVDRGDVTLIHHGMVPAVATRQGGLQLDGQQRVHDHGFGAHVLHGLVSVAGTKFTTARATAEYVTDLILQKLGTSPIPSRTAVSTLPGTDLTALALPDGRDERPPVRITSEVHAHLTAVYGSAYDRVERFAERLRLDERLSDDPPVIAAQVIWAVRHEMAQTLGDVVRRRTALGATGHPGPQVAARVAQLMAKELAWSDARIAEELAALGRLYDAGRPYGTRNASNT